MTSRATASSAASASPSATVPEGPFKDALGKPLIGEIHNGAQPIDQMVFKDDDGQIYMYYGGWKHANVVKLAPDLLSVVPFADGETFKEITPDPAYVEGSFMAKRKGRVLPDVVGRGVDRAGVYRVAYAMSSSPFGPFKRIGTILQQDGKIARGAGHHSVVNIPGTDDWYIAYHRRSLAEVDGNHRELAIERMYFNEDGTIRPVVITTEGVAPKPLTRPADR
jgi:beta-xylosidase